MTTQELLKSYFGDKLKSSNKDISWEPTNTRRFIGPILEVIDEIKVLKSKYTTNDGMEKYFAVVPFIGVTEYVTYDIDLKCKCKDGDLLDPKTVIVVDLKHKETGTVLADRLFGKVL
jgi:hypothetical protein